METGTKYDQTTWSVQSNPTTVL